jgi:uridine kinase
MQERNSSAAKRSLVIGIAGISGSGKSTIARALAAELKSAAVVELDSYYRDLSHLRMAERELQNFDHPDALDSAGLIADLALAIQGEAIFCPTYDFVTHTRTGKGKQLAVQEFLIVEGLLTLHWPELRANFGAKIFVEIANETAFERRLRRDIRDRGRTPESVRQQYEKSVWPMAEQFVLPSREHAELVVSGVAPIENSVREIMELIRRRQGELRSSATHQNR